MMADNFEEDFIKYWGAQKYTNHLRRNITNMIKIQREGFKKHFNDHIAQGGVKYMLIRAKGRFKKNSGIFH